MRRLLPIALLLLSCTGTDVGNPPRGELTRFDTTECKTQLASVGDKRLYKGLDPVQDWMPDARLYSGLTCVLWEREDDTLHVRLVNHGDGCGLESQWKPRLLPREGGIDLALARNDCIEAGCLGCLYDLAFDVRLPAPLQSASEFELRVLGDTCHATEPAVHYALQLDASAQRGASCRYTYRSGVTAWLHASPGDPRVPCGSFDDVQSRDCVHGVCTDVEPGRQLCLPACERDEECQPDDVTACVDGVCKLRESAL